MMLHGSVGLVIVSPFHCEEAVMCNKSDRSHS